VNRLYYHVTFGIVVNVSVGTHNALGERRGPIASFSTQCLGNVAMIR
jgi:hypothetical protein